MWLTSVSINRRVTISMLIFGLIVLGLEGLSRMPWDLNPDVDFPFISVSVPYPGAGPAEIEQRILRPLEDEVSTINGVDYVTSTAYENLGLVMIAFMYGQDIDVAASDVRDAVSRSRAAFPDDAQEPAIYKIDINASPIFTIGVTGQRESQDLRELVDDQIKPRLGQVAGVAGVSVTGGDQREIQVLAHKQRLDAVGLSVYSLAQKLRSENLDVPAGSIKEGTRDYSVRVLGEFKSLDEIQGLLIDTPNGGLVPLHSVADVVDTVAEPDYYARIDGEPAVTVGVMKQSGANTVGVIEGCMKQLEGLFGGTGEDQGTGELPADLRMVVAQDDSERVVEAIKDVRDALVYGALLAALVVFLFLHNFRGTVIVALAIPTSMIATFLVTGTAMGFSLNTMVMLGLALSVGILVDDSIVVLENIDRHLHRGEQPKAAAFNGRTEIGSAAIGITSVDVVVFIPIALMGGIVGRFFFCFGITAATCTLLSLFVSFTLTPMLASWWYQRRDRRSETTGGFWYRMFSAWDSAYLWLEGRYRRLLAPAIRHPYITVTVGVGILLVVLVGVAPRLGFEFFPSSDAGMVSVTVEAAVGTRLEDTDLVIREIERRLLDEGKYPEIEHISAVTGRQGGGLVGGGSSGGQYGQIAITMSRRKARVKAGQRSDQQLGADLRKDLADLPNVIVKVTVGESHGPGGASLELQVMCEDQDTLAEASNDLMHKVAQIPGLLYVDLSAKAGRPELHIDIDRKRAVDYGLSASQIGMAVRTAIDGNTEGKFREAGDEYDIRVQLAEIDRSNIPDVSSLIVGTNRDDIPIKLGDVADVYVSTGPSRIERHNRQRMVTVSAALDPKIIQAGGAQKAVDEILKTWSAPGVTTNWAGSIKMMQESFAFLFQALFLAILLVYLVVAALYNSVSQPMIIMFTIPMAVIGGMLGLWVTQSNLSLVAMIGFIMLIGLVGKNAILVVDYTNTLRARGLGRTEALLEAGPTRMKPVVMTTLATVMGMIPTALAVNEGSEWRSPMAVVVIFGLVVSTLISLLAVPAMYAILDQITIFLGRMASGILSMVGIRKQNGSGPGEPGDDGPGEAPPALPEGVGPSYALPAVVPPPSAEPPAVEPPPVLPVVIEPSAADELAPQPPGPADEAPSAYASAAAGIPRSVLGRRKPRRSGDSNFR